LNAEAFARVRIAMSRKRRFFLVHQRPDAVRDQERLATRAAELLDLLVRFVLLPRALVEQDDLRRGRVFPFGKPGVQPRQFVVDDLRVAADHRAREHRVHEVDHRVRRAEVPRQRQQLPAVVAPVSMEPIEK